MNPNVQTVQYFQQSNLDQRQGGGGNQTTAVPFHSGSTIEFHPTSSGTNFHPNTSGTFHTNGTTTTFIPSNVSQLRSLKGWMAGPSKKFFLFLKKGI